jgi:uncharacterized membrane protein YfcA
MHVTVTTLMIICPLTFLAGFIDSIAGGGGLITLPSYLFIGLPAHYALGTNKFSSTFGTLTATVRYARGGHIHFASALVAAAAALVGSYAGASLSFLFDERLLRWLLVALLPVIAVFMFAHKKFGTEDRSAGISGSKMTALSLLIGFAIGAYDGFFGPGTGTFLILAFTALTGFSLATASGNAKVVNLASNIAALVAFSVNGTVILAIGIPAAFSGMAGNWLGSGLAVKNKAKIIRPVFGLAVGLLFVKVVWDLIK